MKGGNRVAKKKQNYSEQNVDEMVEQLKRSYQSGESAGEDQADPSADDEAFAKMLMDMFGKHSEDRTDAPAKKSNELYSAEDFMPDQEDEDEIEVEIEEELEEEIEEELEEEIEEEPDDTDTEQVAEQIRLQAQAQIEAQVQTELAVTPEPEDEDEDGEIPEDELPWFADDELDEEDLREIAEYEALVAEDEQESEMEQMLAEDEDDDFDPDEAYEEDVEELEEELEENVEEEFEEEPEEEPEEQPEEQPEEDYDDYLEEDEENPEEDFDLYEELPIEDDEIDDEVDEEYRTDDGQAFEEPSVSWPLSGHAPEYPIPWEDAEEQELSEDEAEEQELLEDEAEEQELLEDESEEEPEDQPSNDESDHYVEDFLDSLGDWQQSVASVKAELHAENVSEQACKHDQQPAEQAEEVVTAKQEPTEPVDTQPVPEYPEDDPMQGRLAGKPAVAVNAPDGFVELDEKDIHLMRTLGYGEEVKGRVGSERVRRAIDAQKKKNMSRGTENPTCFAYRGKEYLDASDEAEIKQAYRREKLWVIVRLAISIAALFVLIALDNAYLLNALDGVHMPEIITSPIYPIIAAALLAMAVACSARRLWQGLCSIFCAKQSLYSVAAVLSVLSLLYDILLVFASRGQYMMFNSLAVLALVLCVIRDVLRLHVQEQTFGLVRSGKDRYGIEKAADTTGVPSRLPVRDAAEMPQAHVGAYRVRRVHHFGGYFRRMGDAGEHTALVSIVFGVLAVAGIAAACVTYIVSGRLLDAVGAFMICVNGGMPLSMLVFTAIPAFVASRTLAKSGCGLIGDGCRDEYRDARELMFDASLMFTAQSAAKITVRGDSEISTYMEKARLLLNALGSTLAGIAGESLADDPAVKIEIMSVADNGMTLYMDGVTCVMMGDYDYLTARGVRLPGRELEKNYKRRRDSAVIYLAFDGVFRIGYSVDHKLRKEFLMRARQLTDHGLTPVILSYDPCINKATVNARADGYGICVERKSEYESPDEGLMLDCGIVATHAPEDVLLPLLACRKLRRVRTIGLVLRYLYLALSVALVILLCCLGAVSFAWPLLLLLYQALWLLLIPVVSTNLLGDLRKTK